MAFKYRPRDAQSWDRRANQRGSEFEGFIKEELKLFSPKKGANAVRFLPPTFEDASHYAIDIYVHYGVGPNNASVLCLQQMKGERCPLCEARSKALKVGDEEAARELRAAKRALCWMIDRNDEDRGPQLWAAPYTLDRAVSGLAKDRRTGKIYALDDPQGGYDVFFDKVGEKQRTEYTSVQIDRNPSDISDKIIAYIEQWPLPDTLIWRTYNEVAKLYAGGSTSADDDEPEDTPSGRPVRPVDEPVIRKRIAEPDETPRRLEASGEPPSRREQINADVPWDPPEDKPAQSAADRLRSRFRA